MTQRTAQVIEDPENPGELLLDLGEELCAELGWQVGDTLEWTDNKDGTWTLQKNS
jgi:DNA-binding Xre family transcriptional regulator